LVRLPILRSCDESVGERFRTTGAGEEETIQATEENKMNDHNLPMFNIWTIIVTAIPIIIAVVVGTFQIIKVLRSEIRSEIGPIMTTLEAMEKRVTIGFRGLWEHNSSQDIRIEAMMAAHNRLEGAHEAIIKMGGHAKCNKEQE
jgi:hypothetical protein